MRGLAVRRPRTRDRCRRAVNDCCAHMRTDMSRLQSDIVH